MKSLVDVNKVFTTLRKKGIYAKRGACCSTCSLAEIPDDVGAYAFYHDQDAGDFHESGGMYIAFGFLDERVLAPQDEIDAKILVTGISVARAFSEAGFDVKWGEDINRRIRIDTKTEKE